MVSPVLCCSSSRASFSTVVRSAALTRRVSIVGTICVLCASAFTTGCAQSLSFPALQKSKEQSRIIQSIRMQGNSATVPSIVVYVTVPNKEAGKKLGESIVKERLAACVNRVPGVESIYEWKGEIQTDSEELLIIKTRESHLRALIEHVKANHEYEVPEVIAMPITGGNPEYLEWLKNNTRDESP